MTVQIYKIALNLDIAFLVKIYVVNDMAVFKAPKQIDLGFVFLDNILNLLNHLVPIKML